ncbi:hypothetical protein VNO80_21286 [Phaseolus coccineus]|uniref:Uncharacterized protein n=1 Tax=Phaseolus coccineus TaxID=3886 RepID=A0AAN9M7S5_PHACN
MFTQIRQNNLRTCSIGICAGLQMAFAIDFGTGMVTCGVSNEDRGQVVLVLVGSGFHLVLQHMGRELERNVCWSEQLSSQGQFPYDYCLTPPQPMYPLNLEVITSCSSVVGATFGKAFFFGVPTNINQLLSL